MADDVGALVRACVSELAAVEAAAREGMARGAGAGAGEAGVQLAGELRARLEAAVREAERGLAALAVERERRARELARREEDLRCRGATREARGLVLDGAGCGEGMHERDDGSGGVSGVGEPRCPTLAEDDEETSSLASASEPDAAGYEVVAPLSEPPEEAAWDDSGFSDCDA
jgi:hypothetical protein